MYCYSDNNGFHEGSGGTATIHYRVPVSTLPFLSGTIAITGTSTASIGVTHHDTLTINGHIITLDTETGPGSVVATMAMDATNLAYFNAQMGNVITSYFTPYNGAMYNTYIAINLYTTNADSTSSTSTSDSPGGNGGAPGGTSRGVSSNPLTLSGTSIYEISIDAYALPARVQRLSKNHQQILVELWYMRDSVWQLFPYQPFTNQNDHPQLTWTYRQQPSLVVGFPDPFGFLAPENLESPFNYDSNGDYSPLIDEARQVCLRVGTLCYTNLCAGLTPTLSSSDSSAGMLGAPTAATDGVLTDYSQNTINDTWQIVPNTCTNFTVTLDLGSVQRIESLLARFGSKVGVGVLPNTVQPYWSADGILWTSTPARPVGGSRGNGFSTGDWDENFDGIAVEVAFNDIDMNARYVQFVITPINPLAGLTATNLISIDEIAVYGGVSTGYFGRNMFVGYMGDAIDFTSNPGNVKCTIIGAEKKTADNNDVSLTLPYLATSDGNIELADIQYNLLTNPSYWQGGPSGYNTPYSSGQIGWAFGASYTGFSFPIWQGQKNTILGYLQELAHAIGWMVVADQNGVWQLFDPPYQQYSPDRVLIAGTPDGLADVRKVVRHRTGKSMRNAVEVGTGRSADSGSGLSRLVEPNSIALYGRRTTTIEDPIANSALLRDQIASYFIRDYAWRLQTLDAEIAPDFHTYIKQVHGIRAPALDRTSLYAKAETMVGFRRKRELWSLQSITHHFMAGNWWGDARYIPYFPQGSMAPDFQTITSGTPSGGMATLTLNWNPVTDQRIVSLSIYVSSTSADTGFSLLSSAVLPTAVSFGTAPFSTATELWFYMTSTDVNGTESVQSTVISVLPGGSGVGPAEYVISDYTVSFIDVQGPDVQGYYTYTFGATWTSPLGGFTQSRVYANLTSLPSNPLDPGDWTLHTTSWDWWGANRIPQGKEWDRVTAGQLNATYVFRTLSNLVGLTMYWRMFSSTATRSWNQVANNISSVVVT